MPLKETKLETVILKNNTSIITMLYCTISCIVKIFVSLKTHLV